jgi:hypothetical protein
MGAVTWILPFAIWPGSLTRCARAAAIKVLEEEGFAVTASSLGGACGVNIRFNTRTGEVLLRRHSETGIAREGPRIGEERRKPANSRKETVRPGL